MYRITVTRIATVQALFTFGYMPVQTEEIVYMQEYAESERASAMADYTARIYYDYAPVVARITLEWIA